VADKEHHLKALQESFTDYEPFLNFRTCLSDQPVLDTSLFLAGAVHPRLKSIQLFRVRADTLDFGSACADSVMEQKLDVELPSGVPGTSLIVTAWRYEAQKTLAEPLFNDPFAEAISKPLYDQNGHCELIARLARPLGTVLACVHHIAVRTYFFDNEVRRALEDGSIFFIFNVPLFFFFSILFD